jgi:hypothetical protein
MRVELQLDLFVEKHGTTPNPELDSRIALVWWAQLCVFTAQRFMFGVATTKGSALFSPILMKTCGLANASVLELCGTCFMLLYSFHFNLVGAISVVDVILRHNKHSKLP